MSASTATWAQVPVIDPSITLQCLKPAKAQRDALAYPFDAWKDGKGGRVQVELLFHSPDRGPAVSVLPADADERLVDAVKFHVNTFRLPCVDRGVSQGRVILEYVFKPDDQRVAASEPRDPEVERRQALWACVRHVSGAKSPAYPPDARQALRQGSVQTRLEFRSADTPPIAQVWSATGNGPLHTGVEEWVKGYRMDCHPGGESVTQDLQFRFRLEGAPAVGFKPLTLMQLLPAVKGIRDQRLAFDFTQMDCPFDVRLTYLQPHAPNKVVQLDSFEPSRRPLVDWLQGIELNMRGTQLEAVYADDLLLSVPCAKINL
ncbi:hypothetical protein [Ideonella sp.]|uniref:hypothetical protein n=1 Tax=Ideonella sp. TaxID=1929293 RepID=UPI0035B3B7AD